MVIFTGAIPAQDRYTRGSDDGADTPSPLYSGRLVLGYAYGLAIDKKNSKLYICDFDQYIKAGNLDGTGNPDQYYGTRINIHSMIAPSNIYP